MGTLFGRAAKIRVQRQGTVVTSGQPFDETADLQFNSLFSGLRITFRIEKSPTMMPNTAHIEIYNINAANRRQLQSVGAEVELQAGYAPTANSTIDAADLGVAFKGNVRTIDHVRRGADWVTLIQSGDGETGFRYSLANQSFKGAATFQDAAKYLAQQLHGIDASAFINKIQNGGIVGAVNQFVNGWAVYGNAGEELERLMAAAGYQLSIQDHELVAVKLEQTSDVVHVLSPTTGLIGSPEHGTPERSGMASVLKGKVLLRPQIRPADRVQFKDIADERINGDYRVFKMHHIGDTHGHEWYTEFECRPTTPLPL